MLTREQAECMVANAQRPLQAALAQAKQVIAKLQTQLYGVRSEASQVVLTAEGQQVIDATWGQSQEATPAPPTEEPRETVVRRPRDRRGLAQRYPHLPLHEVDAPLPAELAEQVAAGVLAVRRSGRHHDELVVPGVKPFLRRVHEIAVVKAASGQVLLQLTPERIVPGGDLADETIHRLMEGKALDALPFHRQMRQLERAGIDLPKQTISDVATAWGELVAPLATTIVTQVLASPVVHADASWQRVQAEHVCDRVHLWTLLGGGQVAYRVTEDLRHERATELIPPDFASRLVTDAWPGWLKLPLGDRLGLCNAHARRPFADWLKRQAANPHANRIVALYREVARWEHEADAAPPLEQRERRRRLRREQTRPIMEQIQATAREALTAYGPRHQLGDGGRYILDYWPGLTRFLDDPELPPDNNAAENALRINALIRKNALFAGSLNAAHRDAIALTIFQSCRLLGLAPIDYLNAVTPTLLLHRRGRPQDLNAITPGAVAATRQDSKSK